MLRLLGAGDGPLRLGGLEISELASEFGTPLYLHDGDLCLRRLTALRETFDGRVRILFALKANPLAALVSLLRGKGAGAEVASAGELRIALAAGVPPEDIHFAGPGKSLTDLRAALEAGIGTLDLESPDEYEALLDLSGPRRPRIALRIDPESALARAGLRMGGTGGKFGIAKEAARSLLERISKDDRVELRGLHVYAGTQCADAAAWTTLALDLLETAARLEAETDCSLPDLNLGGGFSFPRDEGEAEFDLDLVAARLLPVLERAPPGRRFFLEPGRWLTAPAGLYVCRVLARKESGGRTWLLLDGGLHHFAAAAGFGAVLRRPPEVVSVERPLDPGEERVLLGGPLCTPMDACEPAHPLPRLERGDLCAFLGAGAYGLTFSPVRFLGHPGPAEVLVAGGKARLARRRGRPEDALGDQCL